MMVLLAQELQNKAVPGLVAIGGGGDSGEVGAAIFARYIAVVIQTAMVLGGLAVLLYMFMGAIGWITAGGDSGKIEKARNRIIQALIGLAILTSVVALAEFIGPMFGLDLLRPTFINQIGTGTFSGGAAGIGVGASLGGYTP